MNIESNKAASFGEQTAISKEQYQSHYTNFKIEDKRKRNPAYFRDLVDYPICNPVLIATDWSIANYIRQLGGVCLVCILEENYYLSMLQNREIYLFYLNRSEANLVLALAKKIQRYANKIILILFNKVFLGIESYA